MIDFLGTTLSLFGIGQTYIGGIKQGKTINEILQKLKFQENQFGNIENQLIKLNDNIFYNPDANIISDTSKPAQNRIDDLRTIRQQLEPIQKTLNSNILASTIINTPEKLQQIFDKNPYDVLIEIRQLKYAQQPYNQALVPVVFQDNGILYVGWQTKGALQIFNCEYNDRKELWLPNQENITKERDIFTKKGYWTRKKKYFYNWETAMQIAPKGWHLPTLEEFEDLLFNYGGRCENAYKSLIIGGQSGFNAYLDGYKDDDGVFMDGGAYFWLRTEYSNEAHCGILAPFTFGRANTNFVDKNIKMSIRLVKD